MNLLIRLFSIFVLIWFVLNLAFQDIWWPLVVLDKFAEYFLAAVVPVFILSLFTKKGFTKVIAGIALLVPLYFYAPLIIPNKGDPTETEIRDLRVGTYNLWNHNKDLTKVVALINSTDADVMAMQEITDVQEAELITLMTPTYPHYYISQQVYGGTTGLFSKIELHNVQELDVGIDRPSILADLDYAGHVITVVSAHLNPSFWAYHDKPLLEIPGNYHQYIKDQNTQARMIIEAAKLRPASSATILACDCNSQETASTNRLLETFFEDSFAYKGFQFGQPTEAALKYERDLSHIDYVWFSGMIKPRAVYRAKESAGSDHAPILADFFIESR